MGKLLQKVGAEAGIVDGGLLKYLIQRVIPLSFLDDTTFERLLLSFYFVSFHRILSLVLTPM